MVQEPRLGKAHEKGNYFTYKNGQFEDGVYPDKPASDMDLFNNMAGIELALKHKKSTKNNLVQQLIDSIQKGKLRILAKDKEGYFLDCNKNRIPLDSLKNKWDTKKCLIPSNQ